MAKKILTREYDESQLSACRGSADWDNRTSSDQSKVWQLDAGGLLIGTHNEKPTGKGGEGITVCVGNERVRGPIRSVISGRGGLQRVGRE